MKHPSPRKTNNRPGNICFIFKRYCAIFSNEINFCNKGNRKRVSRGVRKVKVVHICFQSMLWNHSPSPPNYHKSTLNKLHNSACFELEKSLSDEQRKIPEDVKLTKRKKCSDICLSNHRQSSHPMCMNLVLKWQRQRNAKDSFHFMQGFWVYTRKIRE